MKTSQTPTFCRLAAAAVAVAFICPGQAFGQANVYNRNDSGTNIWWNDTPANYPWWYPGTGNRPDNASSGFGSGGTRNNVFYDHNVNTTSQVNGAWFSLRTLTLESAASSNRTFNSVSGGGISLSVGFTNNSTGTHTFNVPIGIDGTTVTFTGNAGSVSFTDNFFINGNATVFTGSGNFTVSGNMSGSGTGGTVTKNGTGTLTVSGSNSYYGGTTLNAGTLVVGSNSGLGAANGTVSVASNSTATLRFNAGVTVSNNITFSNSASASSIEVSTGNNTAFRTGTSGQLRSNLATGTRPNTGFAFLAGNNTSGAATVKLAFSDISAASNDIIRLSEIISITGMNNKSGAGDKDVFVLQLNLASLASDAFLGWLNGSNQWVNATAGNIGTPGSLAGFYNGSFASFLAGNGGSFNATTMLGAWGRDTASGNVWAVLNHNSDFAVIPEPATWLLVGVGLAVVLWRRRPAA